MLPPDQPTSPDRAAAVAETLCLVRRGWSKTQIATQLGLRPGPMDDVWHEALAQLQADQSDDIAIRRAIQLAEIREVKATAWAAYAQSQAPQKRSLTEVSTRRRAGAGDATDERARSLEILEERPPGHQYLKVVLLCLDAERQLEGRAAPQRPAHDGATAAPALTQLRASPDIEALNDDDLRRLSDQYRSLDAGPAPPGGDGPSEDAAA